ncbi:cell wall protein PhiA [Aspergillus ellipticus CBS 707.79]|uniref:Cell wall protein PhiA n=1 Tax=Aspergillus ellipticus CBS 707.79 TaxID=1448320 RepID=A0A319DQE3_9EURO|nr:cell wall protein PhiA [Aspergillus ellipticus CBS 707.79]
MQFKTLVLAASAAVTASALPAANSTANTFGVVSIHSGNAVQYAAFNAAKGSILAGLPHQNASCDRPKEQSATFYIDDGALFLYAASATPQEIFVDASGMGQGVIGYTTGAQSAPGERKGWAIDSNNHLQFGGKDLIACPNSIEGSWSIWADAGYANPGYNANCTGIAARVEKTSNPNSCLYTQQ